MLQRLAKTRGRDSGDEPVAIIEPRIWRIAAPLLVALLTWQSGLSLLIQAMKPAAYRQPHTLAYSTSEMSMERPIVPNVALLATPNSRTSSNFIGQTHRALLLTRLSVLR
jgi:hypothetical protein